MPSVMVAVQTRKLFVLLCLFSAICFVSFCLILHCGDDMASSLTLTSTMFIVDTVGCKIPDLDPYDVEVRHLVNESIAIDCVNTTTWPLPITYIDGRYLRINKTALRLREGELLDYCEYSTIHRAAAADGTLSDNAFRYDPVVRFTSDIEPHSEFLRVACYSARDGLLFYTNFHAFVLPKDEVEERCSAAFTEFERKAKPKEALNILLLGVDSVSRLNFIRHLPKTRRFLLDELGAVELKGYNKVADNTYVNLVPMFAGKYVEELPWDERSNHIPFDNFTFVWNKFASLGYRTLYAEDAPGIAIFNYNKAGFHRPPADYYLRPFSLALEDHGSLWKGGSGGSRDCVGGRLETEVVLDYVYDFERTFYRQPHLSFAFITRLTHENVNKAAAADEPYFRFFRRLQQNQFLKNTFIVFYSDHGMRFGDIRHTYMGKMEERLPFMYIVIPPKFRERYPRLSKALRENAARLTIPFDIYETLIDLMNFQGDSVREDDSSTMSPARRAYSLFSLIPSERTCSSSTVLPHWCTCHESTRIDLRHEHIQHVAQRVVRYINDQLIIHGGKCATLRVDTVTDAQHILPRDEVVRFEQSLHDVLGRFVRLNSNLTNPAPLQYQLTIRTIPGGGLFEATARYFSDIAGGNVQINDVSRINLYGDQSACIALHAHKKFCYCT